MNFHGMLTTSNPYMQAQTLLALLRFVAVTIWLLAPWNPHREDKHTCHT